MVKYKPHFKDYFCHDFICCHSSHFLYAIHIIFLKKVKVKCYCIEKVCYNKTFSVLMYIIKTN